MYGFEVKDTRDPHIELNEQSLESINETFVSGKYWVDFFPLLEYLPDWMPGMSFKRKCARWTEQVAAIKNMPYETARRSYVS